MPPLTNAIMENGLRKNCSLRDTRACGKSSLQAGRFAAYRVSCSILAQNSDETRHRVGGIFFRSDNLEELYQRHEKHLGIKGEPHGQGVMFQWQEPESVENAAQSAPGMTVWSICPRSSKYFDPSTAGFMVNYCVNDLAALLEELRTGGVQIDPHREDYDYSRFAWIMDPDGNRIELWEPPKSDGGRDQA